MKLSALSGSSSLILYAPKLIFDVSRDGNDMVPSSGIFSELG